MKRQPSLTLPSSPLTSVLLGAALLTFASGCGGDKDDSSDTGGAGDTDTGDNSSVQIQGTNAFTAQGAIAWTRIPSSMVPAQVLMLFSEYEVNCAVFDNWEERHFPVLGEGSYAYVQLVAYETPYSGSYDKLESDPSCIDQKTYEPLCPRMVADTTAWGEITNYVGDGQSGEFDETENKPTAPVVTINTINKENVAGSFDLDGAVTGTFDMQVCGNNL